MLNVETSPEAQMIKDRMKQAFKTCAPDYPQECHAQFEAANECKTSIAKDADNDPLLKESKAKSQPAIDECFEKFPVDVKKGVMEIFMMGGKPGGPKFHKKWHHNKHRNDSSSAVSSEATSGEATSSSAEVDDDSSSASNETSAERKHRGGGGRHHGGGGKHHGGGGKHHGGGGRHHGGGGKHHGGRGGHGGHGRGGHGRHGHHGGHHGPRNFTLDSSSSSESNETSSSAASGEAMQKGGKSSSGSAEWKGKGGMSGERSKCRKTKEQKQCIKSEMQKLGKDQAFVDVINTLVHQKQKCKQVISWSCTAKCPKQKKCVFKATKPCRQAFMERMKSCLQEKGFTLPPFMIKEHSSMFTTPVPDVEQ